MSEERTAAEQAAEQFDGAQMELREFVQDNDEFVTEVRRLVENYNAAVKRAVTALKGELKNSDRKRLQFGQFGAMKKKKDFWDGTDLAALVPAGQSDLFLTEIVTYKVDVNKLEQLIRQGEVDRDEVFKAFHEVPPTIAMVPGCPKEMGTI
ncbi:MAG: hypothetical protein KAY24_20050 [Candidatus Eisenbacteria sp.]|nr:hypothetical protein [Candidatus Eisenbacteria bacterium]